MLPKWSTKDEGSIVVEERSRSIEFRWKMPLEDRTLIWSRLAKAKTASLTAWAAPSCPFLA